jgi:hypothetical protein
MRTLQTQVRLRRLLRVYSEYTERMVEEPSNSHLPGIARQRLFELTAAVHTAWGQESVAVAVPAIRRHVSRTLNAVDSAVSGLGRRTADVGRLNDELQEAAVPLLLMLRGMEDVPERQVLDWIGPASNLARTA